MTGPIPRKEDMDMKYVPENWDDMVAKYHERDNESKSRAWEKRNVKSEEEHEKVSAQSIKLRGSRGASEHKDLKDKEKTVKKEPENEQTLATKQKVKEESNAVFQRVWAELSAENKASLENKVIGVKELKGRVTQTHRSIG